MTTGQRDASPARSPADASRGSSTRAIRERSGSECRSMAGVQSSGEGVMERTVNRPGPPSASRAFPKAHVSRRLPTVAYAARGTLGRVLLKMRGAS